MAYSKEKIETMCSNVILDIESGLSLRASLSKKNSPSKDLFYKWADSSKENAERYARACEARADSIFEEIIQIADHSEEDHTPFTGSNVIQRDRLKIDARKWMLAKMNPKKYGDKVQNEHSGEITTNVISLGSGIKPIE